MPRGRGWHGEPGRHAQAARGICTVKKPVMDPTGHPWAKLDIDSEYARKWRILEERLLSIGGQKLLALRDEPDLESILAWGELIDGSNAAFIEGEGNKCHSNAGFLFEQSPEDTRVMTGYALFGGRWEQHSWAYDIKDNFVIETTVPRDKYFGFLMTKSESAIFARDHPPGAVNFEYYEGAEMKWKLERMKRGRLVDRPKVS